jgi:hypothetical protein
LVTTGSFLGAVVLNMVFYNLKQWFHGSGIQRVDALLALAFDEHKSALDEASKIV